MSLPRPDPAIDVVVTGASSGIGTELARGLAQRGYNLVLVARRRERLDTLAEQLRTNDGVHVRVEPCDLGDPGQRAALIDAISSADRAVAGLCNCAGFGTSGEFSALPITREREQVEVNVMAVLELTHAVLATMVERRSGAVLNVASLAAFQPIPRMATYSATKAFVQTLSEALHEELRGTGVSCTALCPGPVPTEWADIADAQGAMFRPAQVSPTDVAAAAIDAMTHGRRSVIPGLLPKVLGLGGRLVPRTVLLPAITLGARLRS